MAETSLQVAELFYSIQGESLHAGLPCLFIRLAGCNLRCSYCDARYTYEEPGRRLELAEILRFVESRPQALVELTGGEPLLQEGVYLLMQELLAAGRTVLLETNGSLSLARVPAGVIKIVDLKCPESGMAQHLDWSILAGLAPGDQLKFVLSSRRDYDWMLAAIQSHGLAARATLLASPVAGCLAPARLAEWLLADNPPVRLQLQLHTLLWPGMTRGR